MSIRRSPSCFRVLSCGTFQNLREAIYETQLLALTCLPRKKPFFVRRGTNYLIRYFFLLLINAYMISEVTCDFTRITFAEWLESRPELQNILNQLQFPEEEKPPSADTKPTSRRGASLLSPLQTPSTLLEKKDAAAAAAGTPK
jgi:hypothetical protein